MRGDPRSLFVSWLPLRRAQELSKRLSAEYFVPAASSTCRPWPVRYVLQGVATILAIVRRRPTVVFFTNPPFLTGIACLIGARLVGAQCWADCHSGAYNDPRWRRFAGANRAVLRRCNGVIFHTPMLAEAHRSDFRRHVVVSLFSAMDGSHQLPSGAPNGRKSSSKASAVVICSYAFDEPIQEILAAAAMEPSVRITFTGRAPRGLEEIAPANVHLAGWLADPEYHHLIATADVTICMTTREATMQNGIVEAFEHACPVITSNTQALMQWSRDIPGVIPVAPTAEAIAGALRQVYRDPGEWRRAAVEGQQAARRRAEHELTELILALEEEGSSS